MLRLLRRLEDRRQVYRRKLMARSTRPNSRFFVLAALVPVIAALVPPIAPFALPIDLMMFVLGGVLVATVLLIPVSLLLF